VGCKEVSVWVCGDGLNGGTGTNKLSSCLDPSASEGRWTMAAPRRQWRWLTARERSGR
jgi:hypothetical protein